MTLRLGFWEWLATLVLLIGLPLAGVIASGRQVGPYLQFPPLTIQASHAPFSWAVFGIYTALGLGLGVFICAMLISTRPGPSALPVPKTDKRFPCWGWTGLLVLCVGWLLAWTRFEWFAPLQGHTFSMPWIGYILLVNALSFQRSGNCLLTITRGRFAVLVLGSAGFWWFFEYLNRFVANWYYVGIMTMGPLSYTLFASLAFATVLPAVLSTQHWLLTFAPFGQGLRTSPLRDRGFPRPLGFGIILLAAAGLCLLGVYPDYLFSLIWFAPLLVITGLQVLAGRPTIFTSVQNGDWRGVISAAGASLICGFFWELWNVGSQARWQYAIPYVNRYHLFAMPILGYSGYLPFGLECLLIGAIILGRRYPLLYHPYSTQNKLEAAKYPSGMRTYHQSQPKEE